MKKLNKKEIKQKILSIAIEVRNILEANNISHFIAFGTLLGAVRHRGFIPWDDDFDIFIFDEEYDLALSILRNSLPKHLIVHDYHNDENYFKAWGMVKDINSTLELNDWCNPDDKKLRYHSLNVDLYRIKKMNNVDVASYLRNEEILYHLRRFRSGIICEKIAASIIEKCFSNKYKHKYAYLENQKTALVKFPKDEKVFMSMVGMRFPVRENDVLPLKKEIIFQGEVFFGPSNPDALLKCCYGNYNELPEIENRKSHYKNVKYKVV